jgi:hypothetical protein
MEKDDLYEVPQFMSTSPTYKLHVVNDKLEANKSIQWSSANGKTFFPASHTMPILIPGFYEAGIADGQGLYFQSLDVKTEGLLTFPDAVTNSIVNEIELFWDREEIFKTYGINFKRGILLYGDPGSGKSCTLQLVAKNVINRQGIVLKFTSTYIFTEAYRKFREIQPDTPMVVFMEDLDATIIRNGETEILNMLDGAEKIEKICFLATTNYPEDLGDRIVNRPSRFDKRHRIDYPSKDSRKMYLEFLIGNNVFEYDVDQWAEETENFSLAHLKELFTAVVILGDDYKEALTTLKGMKIRVNSGDSGTKVGFLR